MPVTAAVFRRLASSLPQTTSAPHFDRLAFRTPKRIFTTLAADGKSANVKLEPGLQEMLVNAPKSPFEPVAGKWGQSGWTVCDLTKITQAKLLPVLREAHAASLQKK